MSGARPVGAWEATGALLDRREARLRRPEPASTRSPPAAAPLPVPLPPPAAATRTSLLTVDDVAEELRLPRQTAYKYMREMTRIVTGRHVRVSRASLDEWLEKHTREPILPLAAFRAIERRTAPRPILTPLPRYDLPMSQPRKWKTPRGSAAKASAGSPVAARPATHARQRRAK